MSCAKIQQKELLECTLCGEVALGTEHRSPGTHTCVLYSTTADALVKMSKLEGGPNLFPQGDRLRGAPPLSF